jgi:hypothetical protein
MRGSLPEEKYRVEVSVHHGNGWFVLHRLGPLTKQNLGPICGDLILNKREDQRKIGRESHTDYSFGKKKRTESKTRRGINSLNI